ncbi:MAG TPA: winged helix-turn-helix domain-containing protein, partial [Actinomycetota bacterium]|nr:winged helix-turn-helix domain-containing protein [Actinomycetota bacterium]
MAEAFARPRTTQEEVLTELRRRIVAGEIGPGDPIRPDRLAAELEVSRVPVREALRILEGEGVVEHRAHHGA